MMLFYVPKMGVVGPPAPWPGCDHDEPEKDVFAAKIDSGFYRSESGKESKEREAITKAAKKAVNTKAAEMIGAEAEAASGVAEEAVANAQALGERAAGAKRAARRK